MLDYILHLSVDVISDKGLQIHRQLWSHTAKYLTDIEFADDLALSADLVENAKFL